MEIISLRIYRDGKKELVTRPRPTPYTIPAYPVIQRILEARAKGKKPDPKDTYKLAVLCLRNLRKWHPLFQNCNDCPLASDCAYPHNPAWFHRRGITG